MDKQVEEVARRINKFKVPGWTNVTAEEIIVKPLGDGYINSTYKVDRVNNNSTETKQREVIASLVFKIYGGNRFAEHATDLFKVNSPQIQSLMAYEMSTRRLGPKLFGIMPNGRIEEYIDSHTLRASEAFDEDISRDMARAFARFHSSNLPLDRSGFDYFEMMRKNSHSEKSDLAMWIDTACIPEEARKAFGKLLHFQYEDEYKWVKSTVDKIQHRQVLSSLDPNYLNRLVKNVAPECNEDDRCFIIDFDLTGYFDRGFDLGGHFVIRIFDGSKDDDFASGYPYPTREQQRFFLERYLEECSKLFDDFDPASIDNIDHLHLEADIYALFYSLGLIYSCPSFRKMHDSKPNMYTVVEPMLDIHRRLKSEFCENYPNLAKE